MSVTEINPQYRAGLPAIQRCRDVYKGQEAIKAKNATTGATKYYPMFVPANQPRYDRVIELSSFTNFTGHTVDKMVGAAFNESPTTNVDESAVMAYMIEDSDGSGSDLNQTAKNTVRNTTIAGRHFLLVNYPESNGETLSKEDVARLGLQASIQQYEAETVPNWGIENGRLSYVVLLEAKQNDSNTMFEHASTVGRRIYYIADGLCYQQFVEDGAEFLEGAGVLVMDFNGDGFTEIPGIFVGSVDNTPTVDKPPILDLANVNISHYQISATESENLAVHGQTTLGVTTSHSVEQFAKANPEGISVGANAGLNLGLSGGFHTATAPESAALPAAKEAKKQEMVALGASLMESGGQAKTATEAEINASEQAASMVNVINNSSDAIETCLAWAELMMTATPVGDFSYRISTEFFNNTISPEQFQQALQADDRGWLDTGAKQQILVRTFPNIDFDNNVMTKAEEGQ